MVTIACDNLIGSAHKIWSLVFSNTMSFALMEICSLCVSVWLTINTNNIIEPSNSIEAIVCFFCIWFDRQAWNTRWPHDFQDKQLIFLHRDTLCYSLTISICFDFFRNQRANNLCRRIKVVTSLCVLNSHD